jgi:hypothetical protein
MEDYELQMRLKVDELLNSQIKHGNLREALYYRKLILNEIKAYSNELLHNIPDLSRGIRSQLKVIYAVEAGRFIRDYKLE